MPHYNTALRNARADAITAAVGAAGLLQIFNGTQPAAGGSSAGFDKLAEFTLSSPFAAGATTPVGQLLPTLPADVVGLHLGTATWARVTTSAGAWVIDLTAGTLATDVILNTDSIDVGLAISVVSWTITGGNA